MTIQPAKNIVVMKPTEIENEDGIFLGFGGTEGAKPITGEVVAFGTGEKPVDFEIGDKIIYAQYMDYRVTLDEELVLTEFKHILGVIKK